MLTGFGADSPVSESLADRALLSRTPVHSHSPPATNSSGYTPMKNSFERHSGKMTGRKTFVFWTLVFVLLLIAAANLALTFTILGVLRLGQGMESLELVPEASAIKFFGSTDLDHIYKRDGQIQGFADAPVSISSAGGSVLLALSGLKGPDTKLKVNATHTVFRGLKELKVTDSQTGKVVFSNLETQMNLADGTRQLNSRLVTVNRIASPLDQELHLRSNTTTNFNGAEGTHMDSLQMIWSADQDITLQSVNGSVVLSGRDGVFIDVKGIPIVREEKGSIAGVTQFKLCVCMPQGKLFRIPVPKSGANLVTCSHINMSPAYNPCL